MATENEVIRYMAARVRLEARGPIRGWSVEEVADSYATLTPGAVDLSEWLGRVGQSPAPAEEDLDADDVSAVINRQTIAALTDPALSGIVKIEDVA